MSNQVQVYKTKFKSFGIIEVMIAAVVIILILSSAVVLSSSSIRLASKNDVYAMASQISDDILEQIVFAKTLQKTSFISGVGETGVFPIECFSTIISQRSTSDCTSASAYLPKNLVLPADANGFEVYATSNSTYPEDYFSVQMSVQKPEGSPSWCLGPGGNDTNIIPGDKCRFVRVEVDWKDAAGDQKYQTTQYFTDWESK